MLSFSRAWFQALYMLIKNVVISNAMGGTQTMAVRKQGRDVGRRTNPSNPIGRTLHCWYSWDDTYVEERGVSDLA